MIRYTGNLNFQEQPGAIGPNESESGLDVLTRTFVGRTSLKETVFKPSLMTPDYKYPQLFTTDVETRDLEGGLSEYRVTYKGMLSGQPRPPHITDNLVIKNSTVSAQYVYDILLPKDDNFRYSDPSWSSGAFNTGDVSRYLILEWQRRSVDILASVSYYAPSTTYTYVKKSRPTSPEYGALGVNGFDSPVYIFNKSPAGEVQITKPNILVGAVSDKLQEAIDLYTTTPPNFVEIRVTNATQNKKIICTNFSATQEGLWWSVVETWEMELEQNPPPPAVEYKF